MSDLCCSEHTSSKHEAVQETESMAGQNQPQALAAQLQSQADVTSQAKQIRAMSQARGEHATAQCHTRLSCMRAAPEIAGLRDEGNAQADQCPCGRWRGVQRVVDEVCHKGREQPVVATVAEQIVYGHGAMAEPAGCTKEVQPQLAVGQNVQCGRQATARQQALWGMPAGWAGHLAGAQCKTLLHPVKRGTREQQ